MKGFFTKFVIFSLGIFLGLLLREVPRINNELMPLIFENQLLVGLSVITVIGLVLVMKAKA